MLVGGPACCRRSGTCTRQQLVFRRELRLRGRRNFISFGGRVAAAAATVFSGQLSFSRAGKLRNSGRKTLVLPNGVSPCFLRRALFCRMRNLSLHYGQRVLRLAPTPSLVWNSGCAGGDTRLFLGESWVFLGAGLPFPPEGDVFTQGDGANPRENTLWPLAFIGDSARRRCLTRWRDADFPTGFRDSWLAGPAFRFGMRSGHWLMSAQPPEWAKLRALALTFHPEIRPPRAASERGAVGYRDRRGGRAGFRRFSFAWVTRSSTVELPAHVGGAGGEDPVVVVDRAAVEHLDQQLPVVEALKKL